MSDEQTEEYEVISAENLYDGVEPEKSEVAEQEPAKEVEADKVETKEAETDIKEEEEVVSTPSEPNISNELADIKKQLSGMTGAYNAEKTKRQEAEKRPDVFEDQEAFANSIRSENANDMKSFKYGVWKNDVYGRHEDGKEVLAEFDTMLDTKPWLWNEVDEQSKATDLNPLQIAYDIVKRETAKPAETLDKEAVENAAIEKYKAEQVDKDKKVQLQSVKDNLPTDLSKEPSRQDRGKPEYSSPSAKSLYDQKAS